MSNNSSETQIARMEVTLDHVKEKISDIEQTMGSISETLAENTHQLAIHIEGVRLARREHANLKSETNSRLTPIETHVTQVKVIGTIVALFLSPAAIYYVLQMYKMLVTR